MFVLLKILYYLNLPLVVLVFCFCFFVWFCLGGTLVFMCVGPHGDQEILNHLLRVLGPKLGSCGKVVCSEPSLTSGYLIWKSPPISATPDQDLRPTSGIKSQMQWGGSRTVLVKAKATVGNQMLSGMLSGFKHMHLEGSCLSEDFCVETTNIQNSGGCTSCLC